MIVFFGIITIIWILPVGNSIHIIITIIVCFISYRVNNTSDIIMLVIPIVIIPKKTIIITAKTT
jgi:hypothetical protein